MTDQPLQTYGRESTDSEKFSKYFQHASSDLQDQISRLQSLSSTGGERADAVSHSQAGIAHLSDAVRDAASVIPAYDQRTYGQAIKTLIAKLEEARSAFAPRPKFSFKSAAGGSSALGLKKNASAISVGDAAELARQRRVGGVGYGGGSDLSAESSVATTPAGLRSPAPERAEQDGSSEMSLAGREPAESPSLSSQSTAIKIDDREGVHIVLQASGGENAASSGSGTLSNLRRCIVVVEDLTSSGNPLAGLTLKNITHSLIICGHVSGAIHLTNVKDSVIVVASRQFRMHESHKCDVYLSTTSRPIIEDCSAVRFAPLPEVLSVAGDVDVGDQWKEVDDFKWLRSEPSPNWGVLDVGQRVQESGWKAVLGMGLEGDVEEVLGMVGVAK